VPHRLVVAIPATEPQTTNPQPAAAETTTAPNAPFPPLVGRGGHGLVPVVGFVLIRAVPLGKIEEISLPHKIISRSSATVVATTANTRT